MYSKVPRHNVDEFRESGSKRLSDIVGRTYTIEDLLDMAGTDGCRNYLILFLCMSGMLMKIELILSWVM